MSDKRVIVTMFNNGDDMFSDISDVTALAKRLQAECLSLLSERDQLRAEVERLRKDVERYRWLREQCNVNGNLTIAKCSEWGLEGWSGDDPDRAIDAAMVRAAVEIGRDGKK